MYQIAIICIWKKYFNTIWLTLACSIDTLNDFSNPARARGPSRLSRHFVLGDGDKEHNWDSYAYVSYVPWIIIFLHVCFHTREWMAGSIFQVDSFI